MENLKECEYIITMKETITQKKAKYHMQSADVSSYDQLEDDGFLYQLVEGVLIMAAAPILFHQDIVLELAMIINTFLKTHPMGKLYIAPTDVELDDKNIYQPDLLFVSHERSSILKGKRVVGSPDLIIEVLSEGTKRLDIGVKYKVYEQSGILEYWIVDPQKKSFKFYQLKDKLFHEIPVEKEYTSQVLSPLNLSPSDFWDKLKP